MIDSVMLVLYKPFSIPRTRLLHTLGLEYPVKVSKFLRSVYAYVIIICVHFASRLHISIASDESVWRLHGNAVANFMFLAYIYTAVL